MKPWLNSWVRPGEEETRERRYVWWMDGEHLGLVAGLLRRLPAEYDETVADELLQSFREYEDRQT